jgi:hypothetical protein
MPHRNDVRQHGTTSAYANPAREALVPEIGALAQWQAEVRCGARTMQTVDPLTRAACAEANARDAINLGIRGAANDYRLQAARIILDAASLRVAT